jgi:hypothetical protein
LRKIDEDWLVSQDVPNPFVPNWIEVTNFAPCFSASEYVAFINRNSEHPFAPIVSGLRVPGRILEAKLVGNRVYVFFVPEKLGEYWISLPS